MSFSGKILLTGANGQLGNEIVDLSKKINLSLYPFTRTQLNITDFSQIKYAVVAIKPNYIINTAAYTAVDKAEMESELAFSINDIGVTNLAKIAKQYDIPLLHISTDYVFDGQKKTAYTEEDEAKPLSIYGQSKLNGENFLRKIWYKHIILRVSWVFSAYGNNFVKTILRLVSERTELKVINDQKGAPTYAGDIAQTLLKIIECIHQGQFEWGTYHYTGTPSLSWYEFAQRIIARAQQQKLLMLKKLIPISTFEYPSIAQRPVNSELACNRIDQIFDIKPNIWSQGLNKVMNIIL